MQAAGHTDTVNEILLANYLIRSTAWHNAIYQNNIHVLEKFWEWAKLILDTDHNGMTVWHVAAEWDKPEILQKVWDMARGEVIYLAPLGSENISALYLKQCFFRGGVLPPRLSQTPRLPVPNRNNKYFISYFQFFVNNKI